MSRGSPNQRMEPCAVDPEAFFQEYKVMKEEYDALRKRYNDLFASHTGNVRNLELSQEELSRVQVLLDESNVAVKSFKQQATLAIRNWDQAQRERDEYKTILIKIQQQHEEAMKEVNQSMAAKIKSNKDIKRLSEERDEALREYSLIMSERDSVHRELEKLNDDLGSSKKQIKNLETVNKELQSKLAAIQGEMSKETEDANERREWAFSQRDKFQRERESLKTLCDRLRKEKDRAVSDLAEAISESEDIKKQKNLAVKQLRDLREKIELERGNHHTMRLQQYFSNSSSFSESRDSAIDSDMPSGHYSIKLPNVRGADHGLVLEPGVYISRILPGSPASKEVNLNVGDRVLFINDAPIDNVQDAILALSEDIDPIILTLSRSAGHLASPINANTLTNRNKNILNASKTSAHESNSSIPSDKSNDPNSVISNGNRSGGSKSGSGVLRDIFRVRLPRKKHSSPDESEILALATLDSAIATGGTPSGTGRKTRKKRISSRNNANENVKNGMTWPRNRNSYTLPQDSINNTNGGGISPRTPAPTTSPSANNHYRDSSYYGQYMPASNTVCVRRPVTAKDRTPLSNMLWDLQPPQPHPSKSVGSIANSGSGGNLGYNKKSLTLAGSGRPMSGGLALDHHGLPAPGVVPHHRYSFGVFDPSPNSKLKGAPERNSVVPTMSDGSSIDFSVKSGNIEILDYYVKRMAKNQNHSSESSDHLDKVVIPPSIALSNISAKSSNFSNLIGHSAGPSNASTLDRFHNRYSSPHAGHYHQFLGATPMSSSHSGTIPLSLSKHPNNSSYAFEPTFLQHNHSHGASGMSMPHQANGARLNFRNSDDLLLQQSYQAEPCETFPRRIRIPSNQSVASRSSTEKAELRNSPMPTYRIEVVDPGVGPYAGASDYRIWPRKPAKGEQRKICIDKYDKSTDSPNGSLGIQILCKHGCVFVSYVNENSLASQIGLQVGDQFLEISGINMRSVKSYEVAAKILRESVGGLESPTPLTLLAQYSPDKYNAPDTSSEESHSDDTSSSPDHDNHNSSSTENDSRSGSRSGSPTPCNSPQSTLVRNSKKTSSVQHKHPLSATSNPTSSISKKSAHSSGNNSLTKNHQLSSQGILSQSQQQQIQQALALANISHEREKERDRDREPSSEQSTLRSTRSSSGTASSILARAEGGENKMVLQDKTQRFLTLQLMKNSSNLGICLVGGNVVGIFVHSVQPDSVADRAGLRTGDQILEYNATNLRHATAEEAAFELAKPLDKVGILLKDNLQRYNEIKDKPGDGFYIRALFDFPALSSDHHQSSNTDPQQLTFVNNEILYIDNTMYNGKPGRWRAWKVDAEGHTRIWGIIPSKYKVEEDMLFKRSLGDLDGDRRSSTITRRSFFRRKSHHRSSSRELASFSDFSINSYGDLAGQMGVPLKDESAPIPLTSYQRVERLDYTNFLRPVILVGALSDLISERLVQDFPYQYARVGLEVMRCDGPMLQEGLSNNIFVDYKRKGSHYECLTMGAIEDVRSRKLYCIMDISIAGVERLQRAQIYPIVILIKFKNFKQIREIKDLKITQKAAKEWYEHSHKVEKEYEKLITACVPGGTNISYLATQVKMAVDNQQSKTLWVPI